MALVLIVDDDEYINSMLKEALTREGYDVLSAYSGTEALLALERNVPDIVLLDLMLPGMSGEEVIKRIRGIPVIVVSAKAGVDDKVELLLGGAADYVTKPFELRELTARIKLRLRNARQTKETSVLSAGAVALNTSTHAVTVNGKEIRLTRTEYAILKVLLLNAGKAVTKDALLDEISFDTPDCVEDSLKVHISNLRRKIREYDETEPVESVWGIGYIIRSESGDRKSEI